MKIHLALLQAIIPSIDSLRLSDRSRVLGIWEKIKTSKTVDGVKYFGAGESLKPLDGVDSLVKEFSKKRVESYTFSDVKCAIHQQGRMNWRISIRRSLFAATLQAVVPDELVHGFAEELIALNRILLTEIPDAKVENPFSALRVPEARYDVTRPPRSFGILAPDSIFDVIYLKSQLNPERQAVVDQLLSRSLPEGAARKTAGDFITIVWGDFSKLSVSSILSRRYAWLAESGAFPIDSSFNSIGDKEFGLLQSKRTREFTAYSSFDGRAVKGIVADRPEDAIETMEHLREILNAGQTAEGEGVSGITLILPSRESAVMLHPLATSYGLGVVYVGEDNKLWNPFPPEYDPA